MTRVIRRTTRAIASLDPKDLPLTECLKDTVARFLPLLARRASRRRSAAAKRVLIAAHGNSLRALVKYLDGISDADIVELNIPTGIPLVYELDASLKPIKSCYLGDPDAAKKAAERVAAQGCEAAGQVATEDDRRIYAADTETQSDPLSFRNLRVAHGQRHTALRFSVSQCSVAQALPPWLRGSVAPVAILKSSPPCLRGVVPHEDFPAAMAYSGRPGTAPASRPASCKVETRTVAFANTARHLAERHPAAQRLRILRNRGQLSSGTRLAAKSFKASAEK